MNTNKYNTTRLSKDNNRPINKNNKTFTESLADEDIEKLLEDYSEVEELSKIPLNTHLRYYTLKMLPNNSVEKLFRMGGILTNKDNVEEYVILSNGTKSWSAQTKTSIFYRKMTLNEIKEEYEAIIQEKDDELEKVKKIIKEYKNQNISTNTNTNTEDDSMLLHKNTKYKTEIKRLRALLNNNNINY